jgi:hypothetical protein
MKFHKSVLDFSFVEILISSNITSLSSLLMYCHMERNRESNMFFVWLGQNITKEIQCI